MRDRYGQSHGIWLARNLDVLHVTTVRARNSRGPIGGLLDLPVVVLINVSNSFKTVEDKRLTPDFFCSVPEVLLLALLHKAVDQEIVLL
jgi:hypothetical protein